ncbi:hypothetical protein D6T64_00515 [Cryobacterium melibiosiphilum]|uniref:Uncharacterized protein n=1 Tax=Cryobacterium melibiosiphilum TaxID=995039 RepID=A0A3A5MQ97_9MICO|nr:hypothetical protein D6T64_00515 [Cryobacterium melibiosiphilum]
MGSGETGPPRPGCAHRGCCWSSVGSSTAVSGRTRGVGVVASRSRHHERRSSASSEGSARVQSALVPRYERTG